MALRDENKWQMVLRNIPELKKYGSQKGKRKDTLAKSYGAAVATWPEKAAGCGWEHISGMGTLVSLEAHYSVTSFMLFYHTHSKQPWWPGWTSQEKWGTEEIRM